MWVCLTTCGNQRLWLARFRNCHNNVCQCKVNRTLRFNHFVRLNVYFSWMVLFFFTGIATTGLMLRLKAKELSTDLFLLCFTIISWNWLGYKLNQKCLWWFSLCWWRFEEKNYSKLLAISQTPFSEKNSENWVKYFAKITQLIGE